MSIAKARKYINRFLALIKWPVAVTMLLVIPAAIQTFQRYFTIRAQLNWHNLAYFFVGFAFFCVVRVAFIVKRGNAETMEHEITHSLFAMLTLHPVHDLQVHDQGGGYMSFKGEGNWLIAISPYFFPLSAYVMVFLAIAASQIVGYMPDWVFVGIGCAVAYNLISFATQLHPEQTDFKVAGYLFTLCFLPGANMLAFGVILAFVERGWNGIIFFFKLIDYFVRYDFRFVLRFFQG